MSTMVVMKDSKVWATLVFLVERGGREYGEHAVWKHFYESDGKYARRSGMRWDNELRRLVDLGFAVRTGRRGGYRFRVSKAGVAYWTEHA